MDMETSVGSWTDMYGYETGNTSIVETKCIHNNIQKNRDLRNSRFGEKPESMS